MSYDTNPTTRRTITAFFDNRTDANEAIERLVRAGVPRSSINIVEGADRGRGTVSGTCTAGGVAAGGEHPGGAEGRAEEEVATCGHDDTRRRRRVADAREAE